MVLSWRRNILIYMMGKSKILFILHCTELGIWELGNTKQRIIIKRQKNTNYGAECWLAAMTVKTKVINTMGKEVIISRIRFHQYAFEIHLLVP